MSAPEDVLVAALPPELHGIDPALLATLSPRALARLARARRQAAFLRALAPPPTRSKR